MTLFIQRNDYCVRLNLSRELIKPLCAFWSLQTSMRSSAFLLRANEGTKSEEMKSSGSKKKSHALCYNLERSFKGNVFCLKIGLKSFGHCTHFEPIFFCFFPTKLVSSLLDQLHRSTRCHQNVNKFRMTKTTLLNK
jgi:hypothetical protein